VHRDPTVARNGPDLRGMIPIAQDPLAASPDEGPVQYGAAERLPQFTTGGYGSVLRTLPPREVLMPAVEQQDPLLSIPESADYIRRNDRFLRRMVAERKIEYVKVGRLIRFRQSVLDAYLAEHTQRPVIIRTRIVTNPAPARRTRRAAA
jgi:excisionase family DNA binding protein